MISPFLFVKCLRPQVNTGNAITASEIYIFLLMLVNFLSYIAINTINGSSYAKVLGHFLFALLY